MRSAGHAAAAAHLEGLPDRLPDERGGVGAEHVEGGGVERDERAVLVEHEHRVGQQVERDLGHRAARRCRSDSKQRTEPAMATLSDSDAPGHRDA